MWCCGGARKNGSLHPLRTLGTSLWSLTVAIWQFVLDLVPASAARFAEVAAVTMTREQLDAITLSFSRADTESLFAHLETLLPEKQSWCSELRIWGDEKTDDIQVWLNGQEIEDVRFRLNAGDLSLSLVHGICALAGRFHCLLAATDGTIVQPNPDAVIRGIMQSRAMQFVRNPEGFLREAIRLDGSDS